MGDIAVVGTSPLLLLDAIGFALSGHDVTMFTGEQPFGGAWWVDSFAGFTHVETACHLLEPDPIGFEILRSIPGIDLAPMQPPPEVHIGPGRTLAYGSPAAIATVATIGVPAVARAGWRAAKAHGAKAGVLASCESASIRATQLRRDLHSRCEPILYPAGGAGRLLDALRDVVIGCDIDVVEDTVERIAVADSNRPTVLTNGTQAGFDRVVLSAGYLGAVGAETKPAAPTSIRKHEQVLFVFESDALRDLSYVRLMTDPLVLRVASLQMSAIDEARTSDRTPLIVGLRQPADTADVLASLRHAKITVGQAEPLYERRYTHHSSNRYDELKHAANGTNIDVLDSFGDLSRSLGQLLLRHPTLLDQLRSIEPLVGQSG